MIGIDEVGRGAWAGPLLVVAARQISILPDGLKDSKILTKKRREILAPKISLACEIGEGWVLPSEIDALGLAGAMELAVNRALASITARPNEEIIMDGLINYCPNQYVNVSCFAAADNAFPIVSAASIYAKVRRDTHMVTLTEPYKKYAFDKHVGYGTKLHMEKLKAYGVSDIHRLSFEPVKKFANL